ncbi:MAG: sigma 54-interacting transcriptional regulator [Geminicoccaceae bacterium]
MRAQPAFARVPMPAGAPAAPTAPRITPARGTAAPCTARLDGAGGRRSAHAPCRLHARRLVDVGLPILLLGDAGKGGFAAALHRTSARAGQPFVAINCAALPETLIESEPFGYQAGAFTGAARGGARGKLLEANGGTLFLDEIGEHAGTLADAAPAHAFRGRGDAALGGGRPIRLDVAVIAATHQPLEQLIAERRFREDLHHRLAGATLAAGLAARAGRQGRPDRARAQRGGERPVGRQLKLGARAAAQLAAHFWPGNIRELRHVARYAVAMCEGCTILPEHLPETLAGPDATAAADAEEAVPGRALEHCGWNVTAAASFLGMSRATLHRHIRGYRPQRPQ